MSSCQHSSACNCSPRHVFSHLAQWFIISIILNPWIQLTAFNGFWYTPRYSFKFWGRSFFFLGQMGLGLGLILQFFMMTNKIRLHEFTCKMHVYICIYIYTRIDTYIIYTHQIHCIFLICMFVYWYSQAVSQKRRPFEAKKVKLLRVHVFNLQMLEASAMVVLKEV